MCACGQPLPTRTNGNLSDFMEIVYFIVVLWTSLPGTELSQTGKTIKLCGSDDTVSSLPVLLILIGRHISGSQARQNRETSIKRTGVNTIAKRSTTKRHALDARPTTGRGCPGTHPAPDR